MNISRIGLVEPPYSAAVLHPDCPPGWRYHHGVCLQKEYQQPGGIPTGPLAQPSSWRGVGMEKPILPSNPEPLPEPPNPYP